MLTRVEILDYLHQNLPEFRDRFGIEKIGLFGSYVREEQSDQSDIDILIQMSPETENIFDKRLLLRDLLAKRFSRPVDVCHEKAIKPLFRDTILNEVVYA